MLIATFGPTTAWAGKKISFEADSFTLEGHGTISAVDVLAYDAQGHLEWAHAGLREWMQSLTAGTGAPPLAPQPFSPGPSTIPPNSQPPRRKSPLKIILIVVAAIVGVLVVLVVIGVALGGMSVSKSTTTGEDVPAVTQSTAATPEAATPTPAPMPSATPAPTPTKTPLAEHVAAALDVRTDHTTFSIPKPKVEVKTGQAWGGGKIVEITYYVPAGDIFSENAFVDGVSPATVDVMAGAFSQPEVKIVDVTWKTDFTDQYGKSSREAAFQIRWKRKTFKRVDVNGLFDRVATSPEDLYTMSDWYSIHPAIWKATHLKDQISAIGGT